MDIIQDLNDVRAFVKVVEFASFTDAGRALGITRSAISRRVADLETRMGVRLLHRTTRHVGVTEIGSSYYARCSDALAAMDMARDAVLAAQETPRGHMRLTAPHDLGELVAELVSSFIATYPEVDVAIELTQRFVDMVAEGFDVGLRAGSLPHAGLIARKLWSGRGGLFASQGYVARAGMPQSPEALTDHDLISLGTQRGPVTWKLETDDGRAMSVRIEPRVRVNDPAIARRLACAGVGLAYMPESTAGSGTPLLRVLQQWHFSQRGGVYLVYPSSRHLSATVRAFRDHVLAHVKAITPAALAARRPDDAT